MANIIKAKAISHKNVKHFSRSSGVLCKRTAEPAHGAIGVAVPVTALPNVTRLKLNGSLDVPDSLLARFQVQVGEERNTAGARSILDALCPSCDLNTHVLLLNVYLYPYTSYFFFKFRKTI